MSGDKTDPAGDGAGDPPAYYRCHVFCCTKKRADLERGCCFDGGGLRLQKHMKNTAKEMGLAGIRINDSGCLDRCELGPVLVIYPEGVWYRVDNEADVEEILSTHVRDGGRVTRLLLAPDQVPEA